MTGWTYDGEGKLKTQNNANSTSATYAYNESRGWPTTITYNRLTTPFASYGLAYDGGANSVGNLTGVSELDGSTVGYGYDALYRLTGEARAGTNPSSHSHGYDLAGNRTTNNGGAWTYDNATKLIAFVSGGTSYTVTNVGDGDVTQVRTGSQAVATFTWNDLSQLTSQSSQGGYGPVSYGYDGFRRRVWSQPQGQNKTYYVFDGDLLLGELQAQGPYPPSVVASYTWGAPLEASQEAISKGTARNSPRRSTS